MSEQTKELPKGADILRRGIRGYRAQAAYWRESANGSDKQYVAACLDNAAKKDAEADALQLLLDSEARQRKAIAALDLILFPNDDRDDADREHMRNQLVDDLAASMERHGWAGDADENREFIAEAVVRANAGSEGAKLIAAERRRQIEVEGWTPEHDAQHAREELEKAAACYAVGQPIFAQTTRYRYPEDETERHADSRLPDIVMVNLWPWASRWYKPKDRLRDLVRAGALIAAAIDRLTAATPQEPKEAEKP